MTATVARASEIDPERTGTGALVTTVLDTRGVGGRLVRRLVEVGAAAAHAGTAGPGGELWFMIAGEGELRCAPGERTAQRVREGQGIWLPAGIRYELRAAGPEPARLDSVVLPGAGRASGSPEAGSPEAGSPETRPTETSSPETGSSSSPETGAAAPLVSDLSSCAVERTGNRTFRVLFGPGRGCDAATQFVGEIPPGRAPVHSHTYDEVVLVLAGAGIAHVNGAGHGLEPGTCVYLPPGQQHCLENAGPGTLVVLGVFQPGGSPAAKTEAGPRQAAGAEAAP